MLIINLDKSHLGELSLVILFPCICEQSFATILKQIKRMRKIRKEDLSYWKKKKGIEGEKRKEKKVIRGKKKKKGKKNFLFSLKASTKINKIKEKKTFFFNRSLHFWEKTIYWFYGKKNFLL